MEFFYQIKGKHSNGEESAFGSAWVFPPVFSGKVEAENKKDAHKIINEEYGKQFPLRVLKKDLDSNEFLLSIEPLNKHQERLFELKTCERCNNEFRIIDKYNDHNCKNKGDKYCSQECQNEDREIAAYMHSQNTNLTGSSNPVIYKITHKSSGKCYIGKTTQVFTLRWYQHFFQSGDNKFHLEIKSSKVTDWNFEVIEYIVIPEHFKTSKEIDQLIIERERYYIILFDAIDNGFNSRA